MLFLIACVHIEFIVITFLYLVPMNAPDYVDRQVACDGAMCGYYPLLSRHPCDRRGKVGQTHSLMPPLHGEPSASSGVSEELQSDIFNFYFYRA